MRRSSIWSLIGFAAIALCTWPFMGCSEGANQILTVTNVTPTTVSAASLGDPAIVLTGTRFNGNLTVVLGTTSVPTSVVSSTTMQATVPLALRSAGASYPVSVLENDGSQGGTATLATSFVIQVSGRR